VLGLFLANTIVRVIQSPMESALEVYYQKSAIEELRRINPNASQAEVDRVLKDGKVFESVFVDAHEITEALQTIYPEQAERLNLPAGSLVPLRIWKSIDNDPRTHTKSFSGQEAFMIWLKAALIAGLVISGPWVFYQIWMFVAAGLYPNEKKFVHVFLPFSIFLFLFGAFMSCFVFAPVLNFFLSFNRSMGIDPEPRITEWLHFVLFLPLGFGLAFQLPLVMLFLERIGVFTVSSYLKQWRIAVLAIWIIAAVVTPSDPISIFYLAVPLMVLFFGGVLMCKWWPSERRK
jgi:sec-independent protein translocase protein TatC